MKKYLIYQNQIHGLEEVLVTVKSVEKIAASSIHFLKKRVENLNSYREIVEETLYRLKQFYFPQDHPLFKGGKNKKMLILLTGNKGLVGGLYHKLINAFLEKKDNYSLLIVVGEKGKKYLEEEKIKDFIYFKVSDYFSPEEIQNLNKLILEIFQEKNFSQSEILYPHFLSLSQQEPLFVTFLPFLLKPPSKEKETKFGFPIFEPSKKIIFNRLLKKYLKIFLYQIVLEGKLSEFSARTVRMEEASVKTEEIIKNLILNYFKERKRTFTQKQLESFTVHKILKKI